MMGMMTLVRVLPPDFYDLVMNDIRNGYAAPLPPVMQKHVHAHHEGSSR